MVAAGEEPAASGEMLRLELVGQDRPGIVREVTAVLAELGVNIEDFATTTENGAWSGERLFRLAARLNIPPGTTSDQVRSALEAISGEIMVDFTFTARGHDPHVRRAEALTLRKDRALISDLAGGGT